MKEIQTNGITILLVEVPEDAKLLQITQNAYGRNLSYKVNNTPHPFGYTHIKLPEGQYQILGKSTELSEEQMMLICDNINPDDSIYCDEFLDKLKSSYLSLLEANGIVDRNNAPHPSDIEPTNRNHYDKIEQEWQEAQSKVKHYLVLKRI